MKRFLLFFGSVDVSGGGWDDLDGDYDSLAEAWRALMFTYVVTVGQVSGYDVYWYQIVDTVRGDIVFQGDPKCLLNP